MLDVTFMELLARDYNQECDQVLEVGLDALRLVALGDFNIHARSRRIK